MLHSLTQYSMDDYKEAVDGVYPMDESVNLGLNWVEDSMIELLDE